MPLPSDVTSEQAPLGGSKPATLSHATDTNVVLLQRSKLPQLSSGQQNRHRNYHAIGHAVVDVCSTSNVLDRTVWLKSLPIDLDTEQLLSVVKQSVRGVLEGWATEGRGKITFSHPGFASEAVKVLHQREGLFEQAIQAFILGPRRAEPSPRTSNRFDFLRKKSGKGDSSKSARGSVPFVNRTVDELSSARPEDDVPRVQNKGGGWVPSLRTSIQT